MVRVVRPPYQIVAALRGGRGRTADAIALPYPLMNESATAIAGRGRSMTTVLPVGGFAGRGRGGTATVPVEGFAGRGRGATVTVPANGFAGRGRSGVSAAPIILAAQTGFAGRGRGATSSLNAPVPTTIGLTRNLVASSSAVSRDANNLITSWADTGVARSVAPTTSAPLWVASAINGQSAVRFSTASSQALSDSNAGLVLSDFVSATAFTAFAVFRPIAIGTNDPISYGNESIARDTSLYWGLHLRSTPAALGYLWDGSDRVANATLPAIGTPALITWWLEGGVLYCQVGQGAIASVSAGAIAAMGGQLQIGACSGDLGALRIHNVALSASDRGVIQSSLRTQFGL